MNGRKAKAIRRAARKLSGLEKDSNTTYHKTNITNKTYYNSITEESIDYTVFTLVMDEKCLRSVTKKFKKAS